MVPLLPSPTLANIYHTPNKPTWLPVALRLGRGCTQCNPLFGRGPPKNTYRGPFHTPAQANIQRGAPFPIPTYRHLLILYLGEVVEPLPILNLGVTSIPNLWLANPPIMGSSASLSIAGQDGPSQRPREGMVPP